MSTPPDTDRNESPRRPGRPPTGEPRRVTITTTLPAVLVDWLRSAAQANGVPISRFVQRALLEFKKKEGL